MRVHERWRRCSRTVYHHHCRPLCLPLCSQTHRATLQSSRPSKWKLDPRPPPGGTTRLTPQNKSLLQRQRTRSWTLPNVNVLPWRLRIGWWRSECRPPWRPRRQLEVLLAPRTPDRSSRGSGTPEMWVQVEQVPQTVRFLASSTRRFPSTRRHWHQRRHRATWSMMACTLNAWSRSLHHQRQGQQHLSKVAFSTIDWSHSSGCHRRRRHSARLRGRLKSSSRRLLGRRTR